MTAAFAARDNVPGCAWQVEGDDLEMLSEQVWDHIIAEHTRGTEGWYGCYTHLSCGEQRLTADSMRWHLYMGCGQAVTAVAK